MQVNQSSNLWPVASPAALSLRGQDGLEREWEEGSFCTIHGLETRTRELLTLHRLSEIHLKIESLELAFAAIVEEISQSTDFPIVAIELYDEARQVMVFAGAKGLPFQEGFLEVPVSQTLSGTVVFTGQPVVRHYQPQDAKLCDQNEILNKLGICTFICIPLLVSERAIGTLSVAHPQLTPVDTSLMQCLISLANYIASLINSKQTTTALRLQSEREQLMTGITQRIRQSLSLDEILQTTAAEVRQFLQIDRVVIYRFYPDWSGTITVESVGNDALPILGKGIQDACFQENYIQQYQQGRTRAIADIYNANLHPCYVELLATMQVRANLVVPILQGEELWGLLVAHHCSSPRLWYPWELDLLQRLAAQVAIAIQQSELFLQVQQLNTDLEHQVQERTKQLQRALELEAALKRITDKVRDSLDESQILQTVVQELGQLLQVSFCHTGLYNLEQATSVVGYEYIDSSPSLQGQTLQMNSFSDVYRQLCQGQHLQFCEIRSLPPQSVPTQETILACAISDNQGVLGDLWLSRCSDSVFSELEVRLAQQVANQCAIAIRQARLYQAAQVQVEELEKLNRLKDDFLSTVSHELRTPISSIKMATELLEGLLKREGVLNTQYVAQANRYLEILQDECGREIQLVNDLLDLSHLDAGVEPFVLTTIHPALWIPCLLESFVERTRSQQQILCFDLPSDLPPLTTDVADLSRVLTELLNNACKYTPAHQTITVSARVVANQFQLQVINLGVEIADSELPHIFDKFYRIPNNDPWKHGGTGLGLALIKKLIDRLGASIQAESAAGATTFTVTLPLSIDPVAAPQLPIGR